MSAVDMALMGFRSIGFSANNSGRASYIEHCSKQRLEASLSSGRCVLCAVLWNDDDDAAAERIRDESASDTLYKELHSANRRGKKSCTYWKSRRGVGNSSLRYCSGGFIVLRECGDAGLFIFVPGKRDMRKMCGGCCYLLRIELAIMIRFL